MALTYATSTIITCLDAVDTAVGSAGSLVILATAGTTLVSYTLGAAAFDAASSNGTMTLAGVPLATAAAAAGDADRFEIRTSGSVAIIFGNVDTSGAELNLNSMSISSGQTVTVTSFKITGGNIA